tara:strand:- start:365 stop:568 length:204 start_codon:yes stop_codon:yes gene_type:complete
MNTREMWEHQVELLTRHCQKLTSKVYDLEERLGYMENVVLTLLAALKEAEIIVDADDDDPDTPTYEV